MGTVITIRKNKEERMKEKFNGRAYIKIDFESPEDAKKAYETLLSADPEYGEMLLCDGRSILDNGDETSFEKYESLGTGAELIGNIGCVFTGERSYCNYSTSFEVSEYFRSDGKEYSVEDKTCIDT